MDKEIIGGVKVSDDIKRLPLKKRITPELTIGGEYYISFLNNCAYPCTLVEIINEFPYTEVRVLLQLKPVKREYIDINGIRRNGMRPSDRIVRANEIGKTAEDAVLNQVG